MLRVLVIDDDVSTLEGFSAVLAGAGCEVLSASTGEKALAIACQERLDLILADWRLPDVSGQDLLAQLGRERISAPCVVVTGFATTESVVQAMKLGAADVVE